MATFVLIHGAGSDGSHWYLVRPLLEAAGHDVVTPDLPCDDDSAGLAESTDAVVAAIGDRQDLVVVGQSLGGFTAPLVCARRPVRRLVLVAAMVPKPGESAGEWWAATGWEAARRKQAERDGRALDGEFDPVAEFFHDVPDAVRGEVFARPLRAQSDAAFVDPWPLAVWPDVPTNFVLCTQDRFFPADFQRRVVRERLGIEPDELDSGHLPAFSCPEELAARLLAYERLPRPARTARAMGATGGDGLPRGIGAPARGALALIGITTLADAAEHSERQLAALHGVGPKALRILRAALAEDGRSFAP